MTTNATNGQMELGFGGMKFSPAKTESKISRASWWFAQMRDVVAGAMDWQKAEPRPEQIWIPGATCEVKV